MTATAAALVLVLTAGACGDDDSTDTGDGTTTTEAEDSTTTTAPPTPEELAAAAYQASWDATFRALNPAQETEELRQLLTGEALSETLNIVNGIARDGHRVEGSVKTSTSVVSVTGTQVVLDDCAVENSVEYDGAGQVVDPAENVTTHYTVTVVNEGGTWKVSDFERLEEPCTPQ
ncbi:MAG TPA: hypothetical protein VFI47_16835 [Acidimicrobiales bacterium]|nr:hypothetical protein [Acidimicrobiales bacterium]